MKLLFYSQGCSSYVGRTSFTAQQVTLQDPQCAEVKIIYVTYLQRDLYKDNNISYDF